MSKRRGKYIRRSSAAGGKKRSRRGSGPSGRAWTPTSSAVATITHGSECKYVDGYLDSTSLHELTTNDDTWADCELNCRQATAVYGCLPIPRQGTNYADRDGRRIYIKNIKIRGILQWPAENTLTAATGQQYARIVIVKDTRTNGAELSAENVLGPGLGSDGNAALLADCAISAMTNPDGWGRYKVMYNRTYRVPPQDGFNDGTDGAKNSYTIPFAITIKVNDYVNFSASTGAIGSVVDNSFHVLAASGNATPGSINCSYVARTAFLG